MFWQNWFPTILDMTLAGTIVICVVLVLRLVLKRAPRVFSYALWAVVLFRLLCPVTLEAPVGVLRATESVRENYTLSERPISFTAAQQAGGKDYGPSGDAPDGFYVPTLERTANGSVVEVSAQRWEARVLFGQYVWLAGVGAMLLWSAAQYVKLRRSLIGAVKWRDNIWRADQIDMPFVMGVLRPKIYLPSSLAESEQAYVIAHERHHIRRGDPLWRALAFAALCLHWFNPLVWLAFALSRKDMEVSCDEAVMRQMDGDIRAEYSESLLRFATGRKLMINAPLAFGEGDTKERIVHVMKYKKPTLWVSVIAAVLCLGAVTVFAFNAEKDTPRELTAQEALDTLEASVRWEGQNNVYFTIPKGYEPASDWWIHVSGRAVYADGMSMSTHFYDEEVWEAGREYAVWLNDLTELKMLVSLPDENGERLGREIDLLTGEREAVSMPAASTASWEADLDGNGAMERIVLDVGLLEENAFSVPWIESADGTKLCELNPVGRPHAAWNTYALTELNGRRYLLEYRPSMATGIAEYSYTLWSLDGDRMAVVESRGVEFPDYEPMTEEQIDAICMFANFANGIWSRSRLLFTTDEDFVRGLVQDDGREYVTSAPVICGKSGGPSYVEDLPWVTDALVEEGVFNGHLGLRERLMEYKALSEQRYARYLETFSN